MKYSGVERLIVKVGTGFLYRRREDGKYDFREDQMDGLVEEAAALSDSIQLLIVSSGAIATAASEYGIDIPEDKHEKAQLASIGQPLLTRKYIEKFSRLGKKFAQCLVTYDDIADRRRRRNLRSVQDGHFKKRVIAAYNENDTIATADITFGDNDILAAKLAVCLDSDLLVMLSNPTEGLGRGGGKSKEEARRILEKEDIPMKIINSMYEKGASGLYRPKIRGLLW